MVLLELTTNEYLNIVLVVFFGVIATIIGVIQIMKTNNKKGNQSSFGNNSPNISTGNNSPVYNNDGDVNINSEKKK